MPARMQRVPLSEPPRAPLDLSPMGAPAAPAAPAAPQPRQLHLPPPQQPQQPPPQQPSPSPTEQTVGVERSPPPPPRIGGPARGPVQPSELASPSRPAAVPALFHAGSVGTDGGGASPAASALYGSRASRPFAVERAGPLSHLRNYKPITPRSETRRQMRGSSAASAARAARASPVPFSSMRPPTPTPTRGADFPATPAEAAAERRVSGLESRGFAPLAPPVAPMAPLPPHTPSANLPAAAGMRAHGSPPPTGLAPGRGASPPPRFGASGRESPRPQSPAFASSISDWMNPGFGPPLLSPPPPHPLSPSLSTSLHSLSPSLLTPRVAHAVGARDTAPPPAVQGAAATNASRPWVASSAGGARLSYDDRKMGVPAGVEARPPPPYCCPYPSPYRTHLPSPLLLPLPIALPYSPSLLLNQRPAPPGPACPARRAGCRAQRRLCAPASGRPARALTARGA
jgi:hypothetical protein